ncbi:hypothetical protein ABFV83_03730 [Lacrimispora sp. BS-2]|uniref:Uncharacterized protein n=1 Tax=Lacrimispora sp. BS-2 TaxID=3151850 RepID=A0AAU7PTM4_9FIRM
MDIEDNAVFLCKSEMLFNSEKIMYKLIKTGAVKCICFRGISAEHTGFFAAFKQKDDEIVKIVKFYMKRIGKR